MHFLLYVLIDNSGDVEEQVNRLMEPYGEHTNEDGHWDWFQIGGRWTGHVSGYDPHEDEENYSTCNICNGIGIRLDDIGIGAGHHRKKLDKEIAEKVGREYGWCNACNGLGKSTWPTQFRRHSGDVVRPGDILRLDDFEPYSMLTSDGQWLDCEKWNRETATFTKDEGWANVVKEILQNHDGHVVVVDYHS
jgi:hypothetical protein